MGLVNWCKAGGETFQIFKESEFFREISYLNSMQKGSNMLKPR